MTAKPKLKLLLYFCLLISSAILYSSPKLIDKTHILYSQLNPKSLNQLASFYCLYPETEEGRQSLELIKGLFKEHLDIDFENSVEEDFLLSLNEINHFVLGLAERSEKKSPPKALSLPFANRKLKGYQAKNLNDILSLPSKEIDLTTALIFSHVENKEEQLTLKAHYDFILDLMALNVLFQSPTKEPKDLIFTLNNYLFHELKFRFPPDSLYKENIDTYTFLPAVVDSKEGVCLGVCILYLSLAQRLDIPLEIVIPPGHIYLRYLEKDRHLNIETTARGTNLPDRTYFNVNIKKLQTVNIKEVVGLSHMNRASTFWKQKQYEKALKEYESALLYLEQKSLLKEFKAYQHIMLEDYKSAYKLLKEVIDKPQENTYYPSLLAKESYQFKLTKKDLEILIDLEDDKLEGLDKRLENLKQLQQSKPYVHSTLANLAYLALKQYHYKDAIHYFEEYLKLEPKDVSANFLLTQLYYSRGNIALAAKQFQKLSELVNLETVNNELKDLRMEIRRLWPLI